jgi:hypothetical protein
MIAIIKTLLKRVLREMLIIKVTVYIICCTAELVSSQRAHTHGRGLSCSAWIIHLGKDAFIADESVILTCVNNNYTVQFTLIVFFQKKFQ